ncbi:SPFH domain-containing protein [Gallaecimonas sp. GXIMD1310]|uniref:SPFH domain-containing protein n=1 Tax=Gallaecimonas sp. GXIMD1310 TaxID=3131926 RepID=UPI0032499109
MNFLIGNLALVVILVLAVVILFKGVFVVNQSECVVIERLGSFNRVLEPGIHFVIPILETHRDITIRHYDNAGIPMVGRSSRIDRREMVLDFPSQDVITRDNVTVSINGVLYYKVMDPQRAVYEVENLVQAIEVLAKTSLRAEIGRMELDNLFESREEINERLRTVLDEAGNGWGVKVVRVELQNIDPPRDVEDAMRKQMTAERERRATVTAAEGQKQAAIAIAQGEKEAAITLAQGEREAAILKAQGERQAIEEILSAGAGRLNPEQVIGYLLGREYLNTLPHIAQDGDRIFLPVETSGVLGSVGAIKEMLAAQK